jgi:thiol-disulfide isomerase/thioredoxin
VDEANSTAEVKVEGRGVHPRSRKLAISLVSLALVGVVGLLVVATSKPTTKKVYLPKVTLTTAYGQRLPSPWGTQEHPGKATVLVFFASWCEPCKKELPRLAKYLAVNASNKVEVLGFDGREDHPKDGLVFAAKADFNNTIVVDPNYDLVSGLFNLPGFPDTVFIGADGELIERHIGPLSAKEFGASYQQLVERS